MMPLLGLVAGIVVGAAHAVDTAAIVEPTPSPVAQLSASITVKVSDRDAAAAHVIAAAESVGGYFSALDARHVELRVPASACDQVLASAAAEGRVIDRSFDSADQTEYLSQLRARLHSREEMLAKYNEVLATAGPDAVVTVERSIVALIQDIEQMRGEAGLLEHQVAFASVAVWFDFADRSAPVADGSSNFPWLNELNLGGLLGDFAWREGSRRGAPAARVPTPQGFSVYRKGRAFRATTSDNVVFEVRGVRTKSTASLEFWAEAMRVRALGAGYRVLAEGPISAGTVSGTVLELGAPMGPDDMVYWTVVFDLGHKLVVVEAGGEVTAFEARRAAIVDAVKAMGVAG